MTVKVAINGYGRIGRMVLRAIYELNRQDEIKVVAINSSHPIETNVHLTKYDTTHGRFEADVTGDDSHMYVNGDKIAMIADRNPENIKWSDHGVDLVMECTGVFKDKAGASKHFVGGAKKVLISAPGGDDIDATVVFGVNDDVLTADHNIVSNASCTTNCLAPVAKALHEGLGIESGLVNTIHAYTNDQNIIDNQHKDLRRARAAAQSVIPTKTGAAKAVGLVLPELNGKLDGFAMRVPTLNVSTVDLTFTASRNTTVEEVNQIIKQAADENVLAYNDEPLVSIDFNHHAASSIFDATQTRVIGGNLVKIVTWYDNEWGFSCRMIDTALAMMKA
ncbi:type I glyceraldehyde-3-phosphate dehydrogenase [Pleionea mediterranea]|jgi:glyceraldehyde 3-phosphate dehydrogenase|uniref:Glyceraldehyde-3-phosphate dehydrogenase n=1 Tax=Pleionea mediterranea TaxID=523701 RepID=A0A316FYS5_9GAMM|nr:type I glyceraldehyde-3-phosphate dehydrogenase [Pleionea mediterranea]PWK53688.1 glyceraldehyde-3-phosphate dehydrogenase (NAD+) [Pleionea mediterranea]